LGFGAPTPKAVYKDMLEKEGSFKNSFPSGWQGFVMLQTLVEMV
jgi:hypothetical protein